MTPQTFVGGGEYTYVWPSRPELSLSNVLNKEVQSTNSFLNCKGHVFYTLRPENTNKIKVENSPFHLIV